MITACWKFVVVSFHLSNALINKVLCSYILKYTALTVIHHTIMPILFHWEACKQEQKGESWDPLIKARFPETELHIFLKL